MKREFKHRIWDGNMMWYPSYIDFRDNTHYEDFLELEDGRTIKGQVVMEYLGISDKNGIEIYEGDVLRDNVGRLWIPKYSLITLGVVFEYLKDRTKKQEYSRFDSNQKPFEWIGNEFEHPHLLKPTSESNTLPK